MIIDFKYWSTLYEYLDKKCKLNGDVMHDAKTIQRVLNLWRNASFDYLKISNTQDLVKIWCNIEEINRMDSYIYVFEVAIYDLLQENHHFHILNEVYIEIQGFAKLVFFLL